MQYRGWDEDRYALADIYDAVQAGNHLFMMANRDRSKPKPKAPTPYPRPDDHKKTEAPKPGSFAAMVVAAKKAARERREREEANAE
ncbi:putative tail assembly chaperone [Mycobacterium phage GS4E]|nr:putative tail assembly chaperone [Mycobacterium phage GS4E]